MAAGPWAHDFILRSVPVDGAVTYHSHLASNAGGKRLSWRRRIEAIRDIVEQRPDVVVDIRGDLGTLVAALLSRATHRADRGAWRMHRAIRRLFPRRGEGFPRELHELEESLAIAGALGIETNHRRLQLLTHPDDERHVDALLKEFGFPSRPLVALHPGASEPGKMWPAERFGALAARLAREHELRFAITGIARERPLAQEIAQRLDSPTIDLCGRLSSASSTSFIAAARYGSGTTPARCISPLPRNGPWSSCGAPPRRTNITRLASHALSFPGRPIPMRRAPPPPTTWPDFPSTTPGRDCPAFLPALPFC